MPTAEDALGDEETSALFNSLEGLRGFILAISGGPDSTALLLLAARWARQLKHPPRLLAVTIDHRLRPQSGNEAAAVKRLARILGVPHRTLRWHARRPRSGLQEAARMARYRLLAQAAAGAGYAHILTAHTLDDQAETVLFRLARGSGLAGLGAMARASPLPAAAKQDIVLIRPLLQIPKGRLLATLKAAGIGYSDDPTNRDPRFARTRMRTLMPALAREGLDARGLARLAARMRRAESCIEFAVDAAHAALMPSPWPERGPIVFETARFNHLPAEVALRLLGRAVAHAGNEGPVELGKLESVYDALCSSRSRLRRTLAGALITLAERTLTVERAPARAARAAPIAGNRRFTK